MNVKRIPPAHREHGRDQKVGARAKWCISSAECGMKDCAIILDEHQRDSHMPRSAEVVLKIYQKNCGPTLREPRLLFSSHAAVWNSTKSSTCGGGSPSLISGIAASMIVVIGPGKLTFATD